MAKSPGDDYERDLLDIIPERYNDADADSHQARAGHRLRSWVLIGGAVIAVGAIVAAGLHFVGGRKGAGLGVPVIKADDRPIKTRPDDRGGMQVPNQDKLVYERMDSAGENEPKVERLLPKPEAAKAPPKTISVPPLSAEPPPAVAQRPAPIPPKPGEPPAPKTAPAAKVAAQPMEASPIPPAVAPLPPAYQPVQERAPAPAAQPEHMAPAVVAQAPRPAPPPPPAPAPAVSAKAPASGEFVVQLGAVRAADQADKEWARIQKANADLLGALKSDIVRVELPGKGTFWRVRAAPLSEQAARQLCAELTARSQGCIVARR
ncbi:SPOR domain-containing protein [Paramagnetospirillum magneticum]|uniref:Periplasmic protein TonB, links inner and outer membranes n=1 Tax=Paramagnetospirillum magneticum (strain ATCC 700264 / AMB-1) TaxID=342108 RepID=Q2W493_PARM1|nr:SPOR domain-containing protein [Paramagnetospirillum magneticum]BAE51332.1 Periplasmic protein TonB, links inner and outer membranes [Paramagnetospirillum magneticum AMB-1]